MQAVLAWRIAAAHPTTPAWARPDEPRSSLLLHHDGATLRRWALGAWREIPLLRAPGLLRGLGPPVPTPPMAPAEPETGTAVLLCPPDQPLPLSRGYDTQARPGDPLTYILADGGIHVAYATPVFQARLRIATLPRGIVGGLVPLDDAIRLHADPVDHLLTRHLAERAADLAHQNGHEALWLLRWDPARRRWAARRPPQHTGPGHVRYRPSSDPHEAITMHSHGLHPAFWSQTDDNDELGAGFNVLIGDLATGAAAFLARISLFGYYRALPPQALLQLLPMPQAAQRPMSASPPAAATLRTNRESRSAWA